MLGKHKPILVSRMRGTPRGPPWVWSLGSQGRRCSQKQKRRETVQTVGTRQIQNSTLSRLYRELRLPPQPAIPRCVSPSLGGTRPCPMGQRHGVPAGIVHMHGSSRSRQNGARRSFWIWWGRLSMRPMSIPACKLDWPSRA